MKTILFVTAHYPSPNSVYAGHKIAYKNLQVYDRCNLVDLFIISNKEEADDSIYSKLPNTRLVAFEPLTIADKCWNILASKNLFPLKVMSRYSRKLINLIVNHASQYDIIHFEFTHAAAIVLHNSIYSNNNLVVCSHDILLQSKLRRSKNNFLLRLIDAVDLYATYNFENALYKKAKKIIVLSNKDKMLLESLYSISGSKIEVSPPHFSEFTEEARRIRNSKTVRAKTLLYWGAMNRKENEEAVINFVKKFGSKLKGEDYIFYIVGNKPSKSILKLQSKNIIVTGYVENPMPYFIECEIGIVPLLSGAGIKIKTLEMLNSGMPVVSTPIGAEGILHKKLFVTDVDSFFEVIDSLQSDMKCN